MAVVRPIRYKRSTEEEDFQTEVIRVATQFGYRYYHTHDSRKSPAGFPDLVLIKWPRLLFVELKSRTGKPNDAQRAWLQDLAQFAGVWTPPGMYTGTMSIGVYLWRAPGNWSEILTALGVQHEQRA